MKTSKEKSRFNIFQCSLLFVAVMILSACDFEVITSPGGRIISDPSGIDCRHNSGTCIVEDYERLGDGNDDVTTKLTAIPDEGYRFSPWNGCHDVELLNCYKHLYSLLSTFVYKHILHSLGLL